MRDRLAPYLRHLRLPFQLTLAPLYLWGWLLGGGRADGAFVLAAIALHLFLYPGITAFNSAYDRDEGPVGGMREPPPVPARLLGFSLVLQAVGAALVAAVGPLLLAIYLGIAALAAAYSHPRVRLKAHPWASALAVAVGQGTLGFLAGWAVARGGFGGDRLALYVGAVAAALTTLGLYPATQVFQLEEDAARGDRTLALVLGPRRALRFGAACLLLAGVATAWLVGRRYGAFDAAVVAGGHALLLVGQERLARAPTGDRSASFGRAMRLNFAASGGFLAYLGYRLLAGA